MVYSFHLLCTKVFHYKWIFPLHCILHYTAAVFGILHLFFHTCDWKGWFSWVGGLLLAQQQGKAASWGPWREILPSMPVTWSLHSRHHSCPLAQVTPGDLGLLPLLPGVPFTFIRDSSGPLRPSHRPSNLCMRCFLGFVPMEPTQTCCSAFAPLSSGHGSHLCLFPQTWGLSCLLSGTNPSRRRGKCGSTIFLVWDTGKAAVTVSPGLIGGIRASEALQAQ